MPHIYKVAELRPMRDMDILMPVEQLQKAASVMRELGYNLPTEQPSKFMRDMHQLPNASKKVNGFLVSVGGCTTMESRAKCRVTFISPRLKNQFQTIDWQGIPVNALADLPFAHQVSKHLEGLHTGALLKLINVMDVVGLAQHIVANGQLDELAKEYPHVMNTLRCLHAYIPLPARASRARRRFAY